MHVRMRETVADLHWSGDQLRQSYHRIWRMKKALYASNHHIGGGGGGDGKHMLQNLAQMNSDKYLTIEEKSWTPKETYRST